MAPPYELMVKQRRLERGDVPFYAIYDVGDYTFAPHKVVWAEMAGTLQAAVISDAAVPYDGDKPVVPDHKVYFASFEDSDEAHYVCALLNSGTMRTFIDSFTIKIQVGTLFRHLQLPPYIASNSLHAQLGAGSREAHRRMSADRSEDIGHERSEIDAAARRIIADWASSAGR